MKDDDSLLDWNVCHRLVIMPMQTTKFLVVRDDALARSWGVMLILVTFWQDLIATHGRNLATRRAHDILVVSCVVIRGQSRAVYKLQVPW